MTTHVSRLVLVALILAAASSIAFAQGKTDAPLIQPAAVSAERQAIQSLTVPLGRFLSIADPIDRKRQATKAEIESVSASAEDVKRAIPAFQRAVASAIGKLQASGKWTSEFDALVEKQLQARSAVHTLQYVRSNGGARAAIQASVSTIGSLSSSLDADVREVRGTSPVAGAFEALFGVPVEASLRSWLHLCAARMVDGTLCIVSDGACARATAEDMEGACVIK